jgi:hypothetical protein
VKSPFVRIKVINDLRIMYFRADDSGATFLGGEKAWRYNNPGNIGYGNSKLMNEIGVIGKAGKFAVFPDYETGREARQSMFNLIVSGELRNAYGKEFLTRE